MSSEQENKSSTHIVLTFTSTVVFFCVWIKYQLDYYDEINDNYSTFTSISTDSGTVFGLCAITFVICAIYLCTVVFACMVCMEAKTIESDLVVIVTKVFILASMLSCVQIIIYMWHNIFVFLDIFPTVDTCACKEMSLDLIHKFAAEWLKCVCYITNEQEVQQFIHPITPIDDDLGYDIRLMINDFYNESTDINRNKYNDSDDKVHFTESIDDIIKLDAEQIWTVSAISGNYYIGILSFAPLVMYIAMNQISLLIYSGNITYANFLETFHSGISLVIQAIDNYSILADIITDVQYLATEKSLVIFPMILLSLIFISIFFTSNSLYLRYNYEDEDEVSEFKKFNRPTLGTIPILLLVNRTYLAFVLLGKTSSLSLEASGISLSYFAFYTIEVYNLYPLVMGYLFKRKFVINEDN